MSPEPVDKVSLQFNGCDAGWIHFTVTTGHQSAGVRASWVYDPFPDLVRWMHAILTDVQECSFTIEEERPGRPAKERDSMKAQRKGRHRTLSGSACDRGASPARSSSTAMR